MIRIERDPAFWSGIAGHPAVRERLFGIAPERIGAFAVGPGVIPLAAEHGGYLFARRDELGLHCELHSLFTPEGWGREVVRAGLLALGFVFGEAGFTLITTLEVAGNPRSKPPARVGFIPCGDFFERPLGSFRLWALTKAAWQASPLCPQRMLH
ncbi:MAG TPA: hypothetical protein VGN38_11760 [Caulobacteraceae bacterium]|nr:hypothetical protein [Caulobacteraceae bacterium]